jgi:hypothetical protein
LISGPDAAKTTAQRRGGASVSRAASKPAEDGVRLPRPLRVRRVDLHQCRGSSRPNSTLTTEEIASNGTDGRASCHRAAAFGPPPRVAVAGRHLAVTQALLAQQVRPLPRGPTGPTHEWRCTSLARRTRTVRVRLGPLGWPRPTASAAGQPHCGRGGIGRRAGLRCRWTLFMRVRSSPSVLWREPGRRRSPPPVGAEPPLGTTRWPVLSRRRSLERAGLPPPASLR